MEIKHKTYLGQHYLINQDMLAFLSKQILPNQAVVEIGAGDGRLTVLLAKKAKQIVAVEIDEDRFGDLRKLEQKNRNLKIIFTDFLTLSLSDLSNPRYLIGSLPYHIIEPLFMKISKWPIKKAVFTLGSRFKKEIEAQSGSHEYGKLTLLINTFYHWKILKDLPQNYFFPVPPTPAFIIEFQPRDKKEFKENLMLFLQRGFFLSADKGGKMKNVLKEGLINYSSITQTLAREEISKLKIPLIILEKSFEQLSNKELVELTNYLTNIRMS
jgi:16S rRNA (adenine1518-N6/adenine1519-N6)-dimethyltransferase